MPNKKFGPTRLYASCVSIGGKGVLLLGDSGSGKSDLALRLIDSGAKLVSDDQVDISLAAKGLRAAAPARIRGLIEARGVGILTLPTVKSAPLALAVHLVPRAEVERLPDDMFFGCLGRRVPLLSLHAFDASVCAKIRLFLQAKI